jgi:HEAT repeat protein
LIEGLSRRAAPAAIAALLQAMREQHFDFAVLNSALQVLQATSVKTTETLIEFLRGEDDDLRMQAALTLGEQKDAAAIPVLLEALADENANVRYHAIEALGKLKAMEAVEPLLEIAESRDFFLTFVSLDALRQIADERAAPRILPLLDGDFVREAAIETLGALGNEMIVPPLIEILNKDRFAAAAVARSLAALSDRFEREPSTGSRIIALARKSINEKGRSNLLEALDDPNETGPAALVRFAGWFDDEKISRKLLALLENENLREEAARALARHGAAAVELLIGILDEDDPEVSRIAARTLGEIGDERAFEPLIGLLLIETGGAATRQAAVGALKSLGHPETVSRLCDLLTEADANVRESAIRVVGHFGARGCEDAIFESCEDADERIRRAALEQLSFINDERSLPTLIRALKEGSSRVRETAAKSLAQIKSDQAVAALREALGDEDSWTRYFAVRALGALQDAASRAWLVEMAERDAAEHVREAAREVLKELKV